jgi:hypothetical protein
VGRVSVDPILIPDEAERTALADELLRLIRQETAKPLNLPKQGYDIPITDTYPLLKKYLRAVTLHRDTAIGSWIQVLPSLGGFSGL